MTFDARHRIYSAVNFVPAHIITTMWKGALWGIAVFITRLDIFPVGMAVRTERFVVAGVAGLA